MKGVERGEDERKQERGRGRRLARASQTKDEMRIEEKRRRDRKEKESEDLKALGQTKEEARFAVKETKGLLKLRVLSGINGVQGLMRLCQHQFHGKALRMTHTKA